MHLKNKGDKIRVVYGSTYFFCSVIIFLVYATLKNLKYSRNLGFSAMSMWYFPFSINQVLTYSQIYMAIWKKNIILTMIELILNGEQH